MALEHTEAHTPAVEENQNSGAVVCKNVNDILSELEKLFEMVPLKGTISGGPPISRFTFQAIVGNYLERGSTMAENHVLCSHHVPGGITEEDRKRLILNKRKFILRELSRKATPITVSEQTPLILTLSKIA